MKSTGTDIDDNSLARARGLRATSTNAETTDGNLPEAVRSEAPRQEVEALVRMGGLDPVDAQTVRNAGRTCNTDPCDMSSDTDPGLETLAPEGLP